MFVKMMLKCIISRFRLYKMSKSCIDCC